jgi:uncharacterized protein (TIGR02757 family)
LLLTIFIHGYFLFCIKKMMSSIKNYLDNMAARFNSTEFIASDPVQFPLLFSQKEDIEIAALLAASIAWGSRAQIVKNCRRMLFDIMQGEPHAYIMRQSWRSIDPNMNIHRTFFGRDLIYFCKGLEAIYEHDGGLESMFAGKESMWEGIAAMQEAFFKANGTYSKHISNPQKSACKRLHMMLRWLCRSDGIVDLGLWHGISAAMLMIPLDTHVGHVARELGLLERKANDRLSVELLTQKLREYCPQDPIKYDFALFGIGQARRHANQDYPSEMPHCLVPPCHRCPEHN